MSSHAAGIPPVFNKQPGQDAEGLSMGLTNDENEDGVSIRPMRRRFS